MKVRADFVTNSSSSSFTLMIDFELVSGKHVSFDANGGTGETGRIDYFDGDAIVTVSPKQLGCAKDVNELIELLKDGVVDDNWTDEVKIFAESRPMQSDCCDEKFDAYDFITKIKKKIKSMDQIKKITISGNEENHLCYNRNYAYNLETKEYTGVEEGYEFEKDGSSGGDLRFTDLDSCTITRIEGEEDDED